MTWLTVFSISSRVKRFLGRLSMAENMMASSTVNAGCTVICCSTYATLWATKSFVGCLPLYRTHPFTLPRDLRKHTMSISMVFPAPLGPITP